MRYILVYLSFIGMVFFVSFQSYGSSLPLVQAWEHIQKNDNDIKAANLAIQSQQERLSFSKEWEDPTVEWNRVGREVTGSSSQVNSVSLRQTLPIWSERARTKDLESANLGIVILNKEMVEHEKEHDFIIKVYELKKNKELLEQLHKHQLYILAINDNLKKLVQVAPQVKMDSALVGLKSQEIDVAIQDLKNLILRSENEISILSNQTFSEVSVNWPSSLPNLTLESGHGRHVKYQSQQLEVSKRKEQQFQSRPKIDVIFSQSNENGGSQERNAGVGLAVTIPIFSISGAQKKSSHLDVQVQQSYLNQALTAESIKRSTLREEKKQVEALAKIYSEQSVIELQKKLMQAKADLNMGKLSMLQFLDFEERVRLHFEKYIQIKMRLVQAFVLYCELENEDLIDLLEGKVK